MSTSLALLHGAASPLGEQLLLKLAVAGFEVTAQVPPAPWRGRTDEYAAHVRADSLPAMVAAEEGEPLLVVAAAPLPLEEVEATLAYAGRIAHWMQCADVEAAATAIAARVVAAGVPLTTVMHGRPLGDVHLEARRLLAERTPFAAWRSVLRGPFAVSDESSIATAALAALGRGRAEVRVERQPLTMPALLHAVARRGAPRPWWLPLIPGAHDAPPALRLRPSPSSHTHA